MMPFNPYVIFSSFFILLNIQEGSIAPVPRLS